MQLLAWVAAPTSGPYTSSCLCCRTCVWGPGPELQLNSCLVHHRASETCCSSALGWAQVGLKQKPLSWEVSAEGLGLGQQSGRESQQHPWPSSRASGCSALICVIWFFFSFVELTVGLSVQYSLF